MSVSRKVTIAGLDASDNPVEEECENIMRSDNLNGRRSPLK